MAKPISPLLSLGAKGTIGDALTYQKRTTGTITRKKPIPAYRYSLPQAYQRWLYQDYAYLWTQQSEATKRQYASSGVRFHLTGFQYWMKYQLANLPDIAAMWHLDYITGALVLDSSKNTNSGTVFGASVYPGRIDQALTFDGVNDYIDCGIGSTLYPPTITLECFANVSVLHNYGGIISTGFVPHNKGCYIYIHGDGSTNFVVHDGVTGKAIFAPPATISTGIWYHLVGAFDGSTLEYFIDGLSMGTNTHNPIVYHQTKSALIGTWFLPVVYNHEGLIDNLIIYNRVLDFSEIKRHSQRRYPP